MTRIKIPFASEGDKVLIPNDITLDGSVNFKQGYTPRYAENPAPVEEGGSPTAKVIERPEMNYLFNILSENIKQWQEQVYPDWISDDGSGMPFAYSRDTTVRYTDGQAYVSLEDNNTEEPTVGTKWVRLEDFGNFVKLTGDQTIDDVKTFLKSPIVPTPTTATQAVNKQYVDENAGIEIATTVEAQTGTDDTKAITPLKLRQGLNASGDAPIYACRAYVVFDGTNTPAIKISGNISSIGDLGAGQYRIYTAVNLPTNYGVVVDCTRMSSLASFPIFSNYTNKQSNLVDIYLTLGDRTTFVDSSDITVNLIG